MSFAARGIIDAVMPSQRAPRRIIYRVSERDQGARLDVFLKERIPRMSREGIKKAILARVAVSGRPVARPSTALRAGDEVLVTYPGRPAPGPDLPHRISREPAILHADDDLLVVDKPAGLLVHATASSRGATLLDAPALSGHGPLQLVHRLDRETSGVVVLGRTAEAGRALARSFASGEVEKTYLALVFGTVERDAGTIDLPVGRASGSAVHVKQGVDAAAGRPASTEYRVVERLAGFTFLALRPRTGRRHQIRVHLQSIGHPVVGDKLYGASEAHHLRFRKSGFDERMRKDLMADRHLLHAAAITLPHPRDGRRVTFESPLPRDMSAFLDEHRAAGI